MSGYNQLSAALLLAFLSVLVSGVQSFNAAEAQELSPQLNEATIFFNRLAKESSNPLIAGLARESLGKLQQTGTVRQVVVPLMEQPDTSLIVTTMLESKVMGTFLVDTGSSYTVITPTTARKLGVVITEATPRLSLVTANGLIEAPCVTLKNISIGQVIVPEVKAVVQELGNGDDPLLSGLLGMNFFQGMEMTVKEDQLILGIRDQSRTSMK